VFRRETPIFGRPWLVLRGDEYVGAMFNGAVLELDRGVARRLGPDILADPPDYDAPPREALLAKRGNVVRRTTRKRDRAPTPRRNVETYSGAGTSVAFPPKRDSCALAHNVQASEQPRLELSSLLGQLALSAAPGPPRRDLRWARAAKGCYGVTGCGPQSAS
jgi:hypothetical protein